MASDAVDTEAEHPLWGILLVNEAGVPPPAQRLDFGSFRKSASLYRVVFLSSGLHLPCLRILPETTVKIALVAEMTSLWFTANISWSFLLQFIDQFDSFHVMANVRTRFYSVGL